jgi:tRNA(His) guanylyltransferase
VSKDKHEILFSQFGINYNVLPAIYRKGSVLLRGETTTPGAARDGREGSAEGGNVAHQTGQVYPVTKETGESSGLGLPGAPAPGKLGILTSRPSRAKGSGQKGLVGKETGMMVQIWHCDVISPQFWEGHKELLD